MKDKCGVSIGISDITSNIYGVEDGYDSDIVILEYAGVELEKKSCERNDAAEGGMSQHSNLYIPYLILCTINKRWKIVLLFGTVISRIYTV